MQRWFHISKDPNSVEVMSWRRQHLLASRLGRLVDDRVEYLASLAGGKDVLDIGIVEHTREAVMKPTWLHGRLSKVAKSCLGVDVLEEEVSFVQSLGFKAVCADVTQFDFGRKFEFICCGEVLEHLDAPGQFLASIARLLEPNGRLAVTVPNPWYLNVLIKTIRNGSPYVDSSDHVAWFDPCTMCELGERCGLKLDRFCGVAVRPGNTWATRFGIGLKALWVTLGVRPEIFAKAMIYEFVAADNET